MNGVSEENKNGVSNVENHSPFSTYYLVFPIARDSKLILLLALRFCLFLNSDRSELAELLIQTIGFPQGDPIWGDPHPKL